MVSNAFDINRLVSLWLVSSSSTCSFGLTFRLPFSFSCSSFHLLLPRPVSVREPAGGGAVDFPLTYFQAPPSSLPPADPDFPLSRLLRDRGFAIGQNARMFANQPLTRVRALRRKPPDSLFLSAVLDVILKGIHSRRGDESQRSSALNYLESGFKFPVVPPAQMCSGRPLPPRVCWGKR